MVHLPVRQLSFSMATSLTCTVCAVHATQISDSDSEVDYLALSPTVEDVVPDTVPVTGESFCHCDPQEEPRPGELLQLSDCLCGEEDQGE